MTRPLEVRLAAAIVGGAAVVFLALGFVRFAADPGVLRFPIGVVLVELAVVAALVVRLPFARGGAITVAVVATLVHTLIALGELPWWARTASGLLAAAHAYVVVLLMTRPAREYLGGVHR
ncbi:hypothetical protein [Actinokineospora sp.]|uniref:hypothetical protein n=1 Tax=Actinokineospora sp. TaxID=1872133 RepID=UPI004037A242